ncbi:MAG: hypothetical protein AABZ02_00745 [Bacteroidota bacterium]
MRHFPFAGCVRKQVRPRMAKPGLPFDVWTGMVTRPVQGKQARFPLLIAKFELPAFGYKRVE